MAPIRWEAAVAPAAKSNRTYAMRLNRIVPRLARCAETAWQSCIKHPRLLAYDLWLTDRVLLQD